VRAYAELASEAARLFPSLVPFAFPSRNGEPAKTRCSAQPSHTRRRRTGRIRVGCDWKSRKPLEAGQEPVAARPARLLRTSGQCANDEGALGEPTSIEVLTSADNVTFTSRGSVLAADAFNDQGQR